MPRVRTTNAPTLELNYWTTDFNKLCWAKMGRTIIDSDIADAIGSHVNTVRRHWKDGKWSAQDVRRIARFLKFTDDEKKKIWG